MSCHRRPQTVSQPSAGLKTPRMAVPPASAGLLGSLKRPTLLQNLVEVAEVVRPGSEARAVEGMAGPRDIADFLLK